MIDGIIKFKATHSYGPHPSHPDLAALNELRSYLFKLKYIGHENGIGYGNLSIRCSQGFIISASGTGLKKKLTYDDYCLVQDCNITENTLYSYGSKQASSESLSHFAVYQTRPKVNCVVHIHDQKLFKKMLEQNYPATLPHIEYGTPEMAIAIMDCVSKLTDCDVCVMSGHENGILFFADNISNITGML